MSLNSFVILARNENNSRFYIKPKSSFENVTISLIEGIKSESEIIQMIKSGVTFYTYNKSDETFTNVIVVDNHIKSYLNNTKEDNIGKLPLLPMIQK